MKNYAPGLPRKVSPPAPPIIRRPTTTTYSVQRHLARRAGKHDDLRIALNGRAHSWAIPHFPRKIGDKALALEQPLHTVPYMRWQGKIDKGYGAGTVKLRRHGKIKLLESGPNKIRFVTRDRARPESYALVRTAKDWLLIRTKVKI